VHYQYTNFDQATAQANIEREKSALAPYIKRAEEALRNTHLLNN
jgi:hypothetical protein